MDSRMKCDRVIICRYRSIVYTIPGARPQIRLDSIYLCLPVRRRRQADVFREPGSTLRQVLRAVDCSQPSIPLSQWSLNVPTRFRPQKIKKFRLSRGTDVCCYWNLAAGTKVLRGNAPTRRDRPLPAQRMAPAIDL